MNQKEIWLVVNPSVGLPLFLGSVAAIALIVHGSILSNTTWFAAYWQGGAKAPVAAVSTEGAAASTASRVANTVELPIAAAPVAADANLVATASTETAAAATN
jgi:light-harvesting protein B-800-850 alpha chain